VSHTWCVRDAAYGQQKIALPGRATFRGGALVRPGGSKPMASPDARRAYARAYAAHNSTHHFAAWGPLGRRSAQGGVNDPPLWQRCAQDMRGLLVQTFSYARRSARGYARSSKICAKICAEICADMTRYARSSRAGLLICAAYARGCARTYARYG